MQHEDYSASARAGGGGGGGGGEGSLYIQKLRAQVCIFCSALRHYIGANFTLSPPPFSLSLQANYLVTRLLPMYSYTPEISPSNPLPSLDLLPPNTPLPPSNALNSTPTLTHATYTPSPSEFPPFSFSLTSSSSSSSSSSLTPKQHAFLTAATTAYTLCR